jgi:L-malate glycosyltransferase
MRILIISHSNVYWTAIYARHFVSRGDVVRVVSAAPDVIDGVDVEFIGVEPFDKYRNKQIFITRVPRIRRIIRDFRPEIVLATYIVSNGLSAALCWSGPLVVSAHGGDVLEQTGRRGWRQWLRRGIVRFVCSRADLVHCVSLEMEEELRRIGVPCSKIVQFPVGIEVERFSPPAGVRPGRAQRLICTRKHEPVYDNRTIVTALARLKEAGREFLCIFAGGGALLEDLRQLARQSGLSEQASFTGDLPNSELPGMLREADVYVSASLSDGTSSALLEAMACGLTPVVSRIPANAGWVDDGRTGLMFECGRADQLATALARAMDDGELRRRAFADNPARVRRDGDRSRNNCRLAEALEGVLAARLGGAVRDRGAT